MADEEKGQPAFRPQLCQQGQNLLLHRHIQRAGDLVADQKLRPDGQRPGNRRPLTLAPAHLGGAAAAQRRVQPALGQQGQRPGIGLPAG